MNYDLDLIPTSALLAEVFNRDDMQVISVDTLYAKSDADNEEVQKYIERDLRRNLGLYLKKEFFGVSEKPGDYVNQTLKTLEIYVCKHPKNIKKGE